MRVEMKLLTTADGDNLASFKPEDPACFSVWLCLTVGPVGEKTAETFQLNVCTPRWLEGQLTSTPMLGRHHLLVQEYDHERIRRFIAEYCAGFTVASWTEAAERLGRLGRWEFEDYRG